MANWLDKYSSEKEEAATGTNWLEKYADLRSDTEGTAESDMSDTETITPYPKPKESSFTDAAPGSLSTFRSPDERAGLLEKIYRPLAGGFVGSLGAMTSGAGFGVKWLADNNQIISDEDAARLASMTHGENVTSDDMAFHRRSPVADVLLQEGQRTRELGSDIGWVSNPNLVSDTAGALGSMAAYYIPTLIAAPLAGAAAASGRFLATPLGVKAADMAARGAAWLVHAGTEALSNAGGAYNDLAADGVEDSKAMTAAKRDFFTNYLIKLATEPVGALGGRLGSIPGVKGRMARGFAEALSEGFVEEPLQNLSSNAAKKSLDETYGGFLENLLGEFRDNYVNEVMNVGAPSAIAGGIMGAVLPGDVQALGRVNVKGKAPSKVDTFMDGIADDIENGAPRSPQADAEAANMGAEDTEGVSRKFVPNTRILNEMRNFYHEIRRVPEAQRSAEDNESFSTLRHIMEMYSSGHEREAEALARQRFDTSSLENTPKTAPITMKERATAELAVPIEQRRPVNENVARLSAIRERFVDDFRRYGNVDMDTLSGEERYRAALVRAASDAYQQGDFQRSVNLLAHLYGPDEGGVKESEPIAAKERATSELAVPAKEAPRADVSMEVFDRVRGQFIDDFRRLQAADPESLSARDRHKFAMLNNAAGAYQRGDFQRAVSILAQLYGKSETGGYDSEPIIARERATSELAVPYRKIDAKHAYVGKPRAVSGGYQVEKTDGTRVFVPEALFGDYYQVTPPRNQPVPKSKRVVNGYAVGDVFQSTDGGAFWVTKVEPKKITLTDGAGKSRVVSLGTMAKSKLTRLSPEHRGDTHYSLTPGYSRTPLYGVRGEEVGARFAGARERIQEETPADKSPERVVGGPVANESTANGSKPDVEDYAAEKAEKSATPKEYKYYLHARPAGPGAVPNGLTRIDAGDGGDRYGAVYYDRELSAKEVSDYELVPAEDGGGNQKEGESANNKKEPVKNELASDENVKPEAEEVKPAELSAFAVAKKSPARRISEKQRTAAGKSVQAAAKKASDMQGYYTDEAGRQVFTDTRAVFRLSKPVEGLEAAGANASWPAKVASLFEHAKKEESVTLGREEIAEIVARGKRHRGKKAAEYPEFITKVGQAYVDSTRLGEVLSVLGADEVTVYTSKPRADESGRGYYYSNVYFTSENGEALLAPVNLRDAEARAVDAYYEGVSTPVRNEAGANESQKKGNGGVSQEEPPVGKPAEKIADFGEKIGGARKDFAALYRQSIEAKYSDEDVAKRPLSEVFPAPDYDRMVESGADKRSMAIVRAIRDAIPAKPRGSFKMPGYVRAVKSAREIASKIMSDPDYASEAMARMGQVSTTQHGILDKAALYEEMGHGASLKDYSIRSVITSEANGKKYEEPTRVWMVRKSGRTVAYGESLSEAAGALREYLAKDGAPQGRKPDYAVYIQRSSGKDGYYVGKKVGRDYAELAGPFAKLSEADAYMRDHPEELARKLNNFKATPSERREVNAPRIGADMRGGRDVTPEMFSSAFGFRGVEFGNWVEQGKRQADLNEAYDSLMDMAAIIGVPPKALSLNGKLGLAFGARGKGGKDSAKAHYEPDRAAINLTKAHGAGSLAHEWMHAVDDYFAKAGGKRDMISGSSEVYTASKGREPKDIPGVRPEMVRAFGEVRRAITESEMPKRAAELDKRRSKPYWGTETELQSRAFEAYIAEKLAADGASNDYLVNIVSEEYWQAQNALLEKEGLEDFPYPKSGEMPAVSRAFDNFFKTVKTRETDKGVEMYRLAPTARAQLDADAAAFAKQVDAFVAKKMKPQQELTVMQTPLVLQISDERVKALPVVMSQRTLAKIFRKHNLSPALVKQIPGAMADPIMVLKSEGKPGQVQDGFVVMFELRDAKGNTINVPVALNVEHYGPNGKYECNDIVSAYGRESSLTGKPYDGWFLKQAQKPGLLKYINTKKFSRWVNQTRLVMPERKTNGRSIKNIPVGDESVNTKKFSRWVDETGLALPGRGYNSRRLNEILGQNGTAVKTEADLVKAQDVNPGTYALGAAERTGLPALSVADVAARVKGAKVTDLGEGKMKLEFSNGTAWIVDAQAEAIVADPEIVARDYAREMRPGEAVVGRTRVIDGQRFIDMVAGMSDGQTFSHEVFESAWDSLTKEEQAAVLKTHGSRERGAEMYGEFLEGRVGKLTKRTQAIFQRVKDFFSAIRASLFGKNSEDVFREIASGKVLSREPGYVADQEHYRVAVRKPAQEQKSETTQVAPDVSVVVEKNAQWLRDMGTAELERVVRPSRQDESVKDKVVHAVTDFHRNYRNWVDVLDPLNKFGENIFHEAEKQVYGAANKAEQIVRTELLPIYDKLNPGEHDGAMAYATYVHLNDIAANSEKAALMADELEAKAKEKQREISEDKKLSSSDKEDLSEWKRRVAAMQAERDLYVSQAKALRDAVKITAGKEEAYARAINKIEAHYPHWVKFQKELAEFSNKELAKLRDAGIVSKEMYGRMRELYPNYVPLQRDFGVDEKSVDGFVGGMGLVNLQNPVKKLKGSKRDIIDPTEQILKNVYAYESLVGRQKVGRMIMEKYDAGDFHDLIKEAENRHHEPNEMVWHVWDNGKKRFFKSDIDIYNALMPKRAGKYDDMLFVRASKWLTKLLRAGVTHDLTYVLRNPVRDQWAYSVVASDVGYVPFVDFARGLAQCFHKDAGSLYDEFMKAGGASGLAGMTKNTQKEWLREIRKEKGSVLVESLKNPPKALYRLLGELSETTELASRMGVYMKAKKAGMNSEDAALKARDVMNFNRFGAYGEGVNQHVAFFNGAVQGEDVVLRSLFKGGKPNKRAFMAAFMYITGMTMLQTLFNYSDDDKRREYLDLPMWRKATCWTFVLDKGGDDYFRLSIPKPQGLLGMLFGTLPALFMDYAHEKDSRVFNGMMSAFVESTTPEFYPLSFLVMAELGANHSFFYDREIVPKREQRFEPRLQYGPYTSELAKAVGGKLNISPRLIEHAVLSIGGGLTKSASNMLDSAIRAYNGENRPSRPWYESYPGVRGFFAPEGHASSDNFQAELEMLQKKRNSAEETLKTKGAKALTETERRFLRASEDIKRLGRLNSGKGGIYDAYSAIRRITTATNIDADEKRRRISRIESNIDDASKRGLQGIDRINAYLDR